MNRRRQLPDREQRAAVAGNRHDGNVAPRMRRSERRREAETERSLISGRDVRPRFVNRHREPRRESGLRHLFNEYPVRRKLRPDRFKPRDLRGKTISDPGCGFRTCLLNRLAPLAPVPRAALNGVDQWSENVSEIGAQSDFRLGDFAQFGRIDINVHNLQIVVRSPVQLRRLQSRPDGEQHVDRAPQAVRGVGGDAERIFRADHAMSHAKACHWGRKSFRKSGNFRTEGLAASARIDHGPLRVREQFNAPVEINTRYFALHRFCRNRLFRIGFDRRFPDVGRNFQSYGPRPSAAERGEGISQRIHGNCAAIDQLRLLGQRRQRLGLLRNFMKQAVSSADACGREMAY